MYVRTRLEKCRANAALPKSKMNALVILHQDRPIGFHTLFPLTEGDSGIFHAHIWDASMRGQGIALQSYLLAGKVFMERFDLKRILYKTPIQNTGAIRVKEKLGIREIGEETIELGIIRAGTKARVFEVTREEIQSR